MNITVGADPELFVKKDGEFISAYGLIKGNKDNPYPVRYGAVQVDGMALEFNIDPAQSKNSFCYNINEVMKQLRHMVPEYDMAIEPVAHFTPEYMKEQPFEAVNLGCDPDYNAWEGGIRNPKPDVELPMRTAAGHIHIGWGEDLDTFSPMHGKICRRLVRQLDFFLGLPSIFFDKDTERRKLYGKAGAYRPKHYGVEYRVLSNAWLKSNSRRGWVYDQVMKAVDYLRKGKDLSMKYSDIQDIINDSDTKVAEFIIKEEKIEVPV